MISRSKIPKAFNLKTPSFRTIGAEGENFLVINRILGLLEGGDWLELREIAEKSELSESEAGLILEFLNRFRFVELDEKQRKVRATSPLLRFLQSIRQVEEQ
jgi:hypothetical protein